MNFIGKAGRRRDIPDLVKESHTFLGSLELVEILFDAPPKDH